MVYKVGFITPLKTEHLNWTLILTFLVQIFTTFLNYQLQEGRLFRHVWDNWSSFKVSLKTYVHLFIDIKECHSLTVWWVREVKWIMCEAKETYPY